MCGIITAAGLSNRMGDFKPLLPWKGHSLIRYQVQTLKSAGCHYVVVVTGYRSKDIEKEFQENDVIIAHNIDYKSGRVSSIKVGVMAAPVDVGAYLFLGVDQPRTVQIISTVVESHGNSGAMVTSPRYQGSGGHPVIFSADLRDQILKISENTNGMREIFEENRHRLNEIHISDRRVKLDLNTEEDYLSAFAEYGVSNSPID